MKKVIAVIAAIAAVALICVGMFGIWNRLPDAGPADSDSLANSSSASANSSLSEEFSQPVSEGRDEKGAPLLERIEVSQPNNLAVNGYMEMEMFDGSRRVDTYKKVLEDYKLQKVRLNDGSTYKASTGHTIYVKAGDSTGQQYIVSGVELLPITNGVIDHSSSVMVRKESTGERIRVFATKEEYEAAIANYADGQAILSGEMKAPKNCIILNGALIPHLQYEVRDDGALFIPLADVAEAYDSLSEYYDVEGWLNVAVDLRHIIIPTEMAPQSVLELYSAEGGKWTYQNQTAPLWSDVFYLPKTSKVEMPVEDVSRIFGWEFSVGDGVLSIVTDELDNNGNFVLQAIETDKVVIPLEELDEYIQSHSAQSQSGGEPNA